MQRRNFLKTAAASGGLTILRSGLLRGQTAPSNRLNIALVGVWGRGTAHYNVMRNENVVALCDVNDLRTKEAVDDLSQSQDLLGLAAHAGAERHRGGDHLHRRPPPCLHRQLGHESRHARLLRKAHGHHGGRGAHGARQLPEEPRQAGHAARHAAARLSELRARARADSRWRGGRAEDHPRMGQPPASAARAIPRAKAARRRRCTTSSGSGRRPTIPTARSISAGRAA